jgi:hypothetical protein
MQIHHIVPESEDGESSADNGIPLCLDCHAEVLAYNPKHPIGRRLTHSELRRHRDQWFEIAGRSPWAGQSLVWERSAPPKSSEPPSPPSQSVRAFLDRLGDAQLWHPDNHVQVTAVQQFGDEEHEQLMLIEGLAHALESHDDDTRWDAAVALEFVIQWAPRCVPAGLIRTMASDSFFGVRSSAAVSYYFLAAASPNEVPLDVLARLAQYGEDWYVMTPATTALCRLARSRPIAAGILFDGLEDPDPDARRHYATALRSLIREHPAAVSWNGVERLERHTDELIRSVGAEWRSVLEERLERGLGTDLGIF